MKYYKTSNSIIFNKNDKYVILTKTKNGVKITNVSDEDVDWITVRENHIPVKKGQSKEEAIKSFIESKKGSEKGHNLSHIKYAEKIHKLEKEADEAENSNRFDDEKKYRKQAEQLRKEFKNITIQKEGDLRKDLIKKDSLARYIHKGVSYKDLAKKPWLTSEFGLGDSDIIRLAFSSIEERYGINKDGLYEAEAEENWEDGLNKVKRKYGKKEADKLKDTLQKIGAI